MRDFRFLLAPVLGGDLVGLLAVPVAPIAKDLASSLQAAAKAVTAVDLTLFVNFRAGPYGAVCSPFVMEGDALADPPVNSPLSATDSRPWRGEGV